MNIDDRWVCSRCLTLVTRGQSCGNCGFSDADYRPKAHQLPPEALLKQRYLVALEREIRESAEAGTPVDTIFFGGGFRISAHDLVQKFFRLRLQALR